MYTVVLSFHSFTRWLVLFLLLYTLLVSLKGFLGNSEFKKSDHRARMLVVISTHIQASLGIILYAISPIVSYFWKQFPDTIHEREIRFFGMEHITVMLIAVVVITIGSVKVKKADSDTLKFKRMLIWFGLGLFLILTSVPWSFSPLTSRPDFRF